MIKLLRSFAIFIAISLTFFSYQNCSKTSSLKLVDNSSKDSNDTQEPLDENDGGSNESTKAFYAGDPFAINKIPYTLKVDSYQNIINNYDDLPEPKAIAIAPDGTASAWGGSNFQDQAEVNRVILERCQLYSSNQACAIFAEGNLIKYDEDDFYNSMGYSIQPTVNFDATKVPGLNAQTQSSLAANNYANRTNPFKALAIGYTGNSNVGWSDVSQAEATRRAIERCEYVSNLPCNVFAEGNSVVFNFTTISWSPRLLTFGPTAFDASNVPFVRDQDRAGNFTNIPTQIGNGQNVVAALHVSGYYWIGSDPDSLQTAENIALTNCNNSVPDTSLYNCFVYSRDLNVVMSHDSIVSSKKP